MKIYDYFFFTFYRLWEYGPSRWFSELKAAFTMSFLLILLISAASNVQYFFFKDFMLANHPILALSICGIIGMFHYLRYIQNDNWEKIIMNFREIDKQKDVYGICLVGLFVVLIVTMFFYSNIY